MTEEQKDMIDSRWQPYKMDTIDSQRRIEKCIEILLWIFLVCLVSYTSYLVIVKLNPYGLNSDLVNEVTYRQLCWEGKTLYPEGFVCGHESFNNRPVFIYWIFYGLTNNFLLSYQLECIVMLIVQLASIYFLMHSMKMRRCATVAAMCMYIVLLAPVVKDVLYWTMNAYSGLAICVLITLALRAILCDRVAGIADIKKKSVMIPLVALWVVAVLYGYGTIKMAMVLYCPFLVVDGMRIFWNFINRKAQNQKALVLAFTSFVALVVNVAAYAVFMLNHGDTINPMGFTIAPISQWIDWDVISLQIRAIIAMIGLRGGGVALGSLDGLVWIITAGVGVVCVIYVIWTFKQKDTINSRIDIVHYWFAAATIMFTIQILQGTMLGSERYYFMTSILVPVLLANAINEWLNNYNPKVIALSWSAIGLVLLTVFGGDISSDHVRFSQQKPQLAEVATFIQENGYEYVTASYWNAGIIKGFTNGAVETQHWMDNSALNPFRWLIDQNKFTQEQQGVPNVLLITDEEEAMINGAANEVDMLLRDYGKKVYDEGGYNLYAFTENPFTLINKVRNANMGGLPPAEEVEKTDLPSSIGFRFSNAELNDDEELVSNGAEGIVLYGPYSNSVEGTYDITLNYKVDKYGEGKEGIFDIALDAQRIAAVNFNVKDTHVTLKDVKITAGHAFEARVHVPAGMIVRIKSIDYKRVDN